ncbi:mucin-4-like [Watersipora subatra]|uniref:mucin-4-like n=1 Tax=Watersipora subatra TaxID=2589382 RepID=UPI00355B26D7
MPFDETIECPLCMEPLDIDDLNFYPCTCGYQICRFCWHRIRTDENSLCPACRKQYQEDPAEFKPLTEEELTKIKKERRQKDVASRQKAAENRRHLANIRVVQKNLVFVVGLSTRLADTEVLKRQDYFGKYGKILKVVINSSTSYAGAQGPSASAYITYTKPEDCLRAINAVNNLYVDGRTLKASLGTTKYCSHFLKGTQCNKADCMYLHELGDEEASFTKEEMQSGKHQDYEQKLVDTYLTATSNISSNTIPTASKLSSGDAAIVNGTGTALSNKPSNTNQRKKTDSGSSNGSSKLKEPWPLLNSNRSTGATAGKDEGDVTPDIIQTSTASAPNTTTSAMGTVPSQSLTNHSSPSSTYSTLSNPRTPTPEALPAVTRLSTTTASEGHPSPIITNSEAPPVKTMLAARKLPFSESTETTPNSSDDLASEDLNSLYSKPVSIASTTAQSQIPGTGSLGFNEFNKDGDVLLTTHSSDWPSSFDQGTAVSDDDLGFDPYMESNKGLADMLKNESGHVMSPLSHFRANGIGLPSAHHRPPPGVGVRHNLMAGGSGDMISAGIMSSIVTPSSPSALTSVVCSTASALPPPPPGLAVFPQYTSDGGAAGLSSATVTPPPSTTNGPDAAAYRGSRMLGLMNLGPSGVNHSPTSHMLSQSPVNSLPRSPYSDSRLNSIQPPQQNQAPFSGFSNGMTDSTYNTQEIRDSLKALLPNASINVLPQTLQHSRLRNSYMQPGFGGHNPSHSWNGSSQTPHQPIQTHSSLDEQFADPAIVSGCLSLTDASGSPPGVQPHWLKSIQQLTEMDSSPVKQPSTSQPHAMPSVQPMYNRAPTTHSRMPFAQNLHMSQPGTPTGSWPSFQPHNPPPGFPSPFRSTTQNPHMATLES